MRFVLTALLVLVAILTFQPKTDAHTGTWYVSTAAGNGLNLRTGPGGSYPRILTMAAGSTLKAYGHVGNWMKVQHLATGTIGWASMDWITGPASGVSSAPSGGGYCMTNYWREYVCASANTADAIRYWANYYGVGQWWLFAVAACESSFNPGAYNAYSGVSGLFQFEPSTFYWQGGMDLWNVWDQSRIAAKMFASGLGYHWHCATLLGW